LNAALATIAIFAALAIVYAWAPPRWRPAFLLIVSVLAIYALQPFTNLRFAAYSLQTLTLLLTLATWWLTQRLVPAAPPLIRQDRLTLLLLLGLILLITADRLLPVTMRLLPYRPPPVGWVLLILLSTAVSTLLLAQILRRLPYRHVLTGAMLVLVAIFVLLKWPPAATAVAAAWRSWTGEQAALATPSDLAWLGFSYVAFRLIHTLRDRQTGLLPACTLPEFVTYVLFFPAYAAGPIDRLERFVGDYRALDAVPTATRWGQGGWRIAVGLFKKFVIADSLALGLSLTAVSAQQATSTSGLWLLLYGYAFRLYFDFSGYSDIAIGLGLLFGIRLPENFRAPYLKSNLTSFWQSWHITLSDWARFYIFTPLSRSLLRRKPRPSNQMILLTAHLSTMLVIGLWHGITANFFIWGLWHGVGLFVHKQWSDRTRRWYRTLADKPGQKRALSLLGWFLTFHYVVLGWVWFALPTVPLAWQTLARLLGTAV
jgi:alginate O-acetyltransferase complex protein AlgI